MRHLSAACLLLIAASARAGAPTVLSTNTFSPTTGGSEEIAGAHVAADGTVRIVYRDPSRKLRVVSWSPAGTRLPVVELRRSEFDVAWDTGMVVDASGNIHIGGRGHQSLNDEDDIAAVKYDPTGATLWESSFDPGGDESGVNGCVVLSASGDLVVGGKLAESSQSGPGVIVKFDGISGAVLWSRTISVNTSMEALATDTTNNFYTLANVGAALEVRKYGGAGNLQWSRTVQSTGWSQITYGNNAVVVVGGTSPVRVERLNPADGTTLTSSAFLFPGNAPEPNGVTVAPVSGSIFISAAVLNAGTGLYDGMVIGLATAGSSTTFYRAYAGGLNESGGNTDSAIRADASDGVYVGLGNSTGGTCNAAGDLLARKVDARDGTLVWSDLYDGPIYTRPNGAVRDAAGNTYVITEEPGLLIKYNAAGSLVWTRSASDPAYCVDRFDAIAINAAGTAVYLATDARLSTTFCCLADETDLYVARFDNNGAQYTPFTYTPGGDVRAKGLAFDSLGNVYLAGGTRTNTGSGDEDYSLLVKFNTIGQVQWSRTTMRAAFEGAMGVSIDAADGIYLAVPGVNGPLPVGALIKYDTTGGVVWTRTANLGHTMSIAFGVASPPAGAVPANGAYLTGIVTDNIMAASYFTSYLIRYDASGNAGFTVTITGGQSAAIGRVAVNPSGTVIVGGATAPMFYVGEGLNAGGKGDALWQAFDPTAACTAPIWGIRYGLGTEDEDIGGLVASATGVTAVYHTGAGLTTVRYANGSGDAPALETTITASPSPAQVGDLVTITLSTYNAGGRDALTASATFMINSGASSLAPLSGPNPPLSQVTVAGGATLSWVWTTTATATTGVITMSGTVTGTDSCGGGQVVGGGSKTLVTGSIASRVSIVPATVTAGDSFEVRLTVSKSGAAPIENVVASISLSDPALAQVTAGPVAVPATATSFSSAGPFPTFRWTVKALKAGTLSVVCGASGTVLAGGPESTQATGSVEIQAALRIPEFDGDAIVFPNPVAGDTMQVAVKLEGGITDITMEVYNTGFQRVYHGEWTGLSGAATLLDVKGMAVWGPGAYFIRMTGTGGGVTKVYPTVRMRVKRTGATTP